ncbi:MAG: signal peptidase I [Bacteroidia bacterium]|nr:signal peptidase I [Bacteroidia bacterium]
MRKILAYVIGLFIIFLIIRTFIISWVFVPDDSMNPDFKKGDLLFINKLSYGARIPKTVLCIPFTDHYLDWISIPYFRIPALAGIKRNDLVAFNYPVKHDIPVDRKPECIKRCIGLPGDHLKISDKEIFIGETLLNCNYAGFTWRIVTDGKGLPGSLLEKYKIHHVSEIIESSIYDAGMTCLTAQELRKEKGIRDVRILRINSTNEVRMYPGSDHFSWTRDNYGPLVIPAKGMTIPMNSVNMDLYSTIIYNYEKNNVLIQDGKIFINGIESATYTFKMNYYFVLDDNRDHANDSRYWGFLPEDHIIGKAIRF